MEKRIKALYIITIIAIFAFLCMQGYWLFNRYEYSLTEYERDLSERIAKCVDDYNVIREKSSDTIADPLKQKGTDNVMTIPTFSLKQEYGDTVKTTRTAKISTYLFSAHELLGLKPGTPLTDAQKNKAMELAQLQMNEPADSAVFDASGAKDEKEAWVATKNVITERKCPFSIEGLDSVLNKTGIKAKINLNCADSMVWHPEVKNHQSTFSPCLLMTIPYSQLEGRSVTIVCPINPFDILPGMWQTLLISSLISILLIACLVSQISTVLKLSRLDNMRNSFITTMIHELKRPVSTLKMCVSGLGNEKMMSDNALKATLLNETRNALDNLSAYFSKLRDITFNNVEQIPLAIGEINLHALIDTIANNTTIPSGKDVKIINNIDESLTISADRTHMFNIFNNLVENAIKYSGDSVEIKASADTGDGTVEISICDNGNGISKRDLHHVFKRFYRGNASSGDLPGMGLGLTYVKLLVNAHGGVISVDSSVGEGTCFTIKLPQ